MVGLGRLGRCSSLQCADGVGDEEECESSVSRRDTRIGRTKP